MAVRLGKLLYSGQNRGSGGFSASWQNLALVNDLLNEITRDIADADSRRVIRSSSNSLLRLRVKKLTEDLLIPRLTASAASSATRIAKYMGIRAKADRFVAIQVGGSNPKGLKGFKSYIGSTRSAGRKISGGKRGATSRNYRTTLAWGSEFGPHPSSKVNHYGVPRNERGYWVQPAVNAAMSDIRNAYTQALDDVLKQMTKGR